MTSPRRLGRPALRAACPRAPRRRVAVIGALLVALLLDQRVTAEPPSLEQALARAGTYVANLHARLSGLVTEESYVQQVRPTASRMSRPLALSRRVLKSDLLLVWPTGSRRYLEFRDTFEVDGAPVRDRRERLTKLFLEPSAASERQIKAILNESARHNIGGIPRNINTPMLAASFLYPDTQQRFRFRRRPSAPIPDRAATAPGSDVFRAASEAWTIDFEEVRRPTVIRTNGGRDLPTSGRIWLDPTSGVVLMTELEADNGEVSASITVSFRAEPQFGFVLPVEMRERYDSSSESVEGTATYGRFRQFLVNTKESIARPPGAR